MWCTKGDVVRRAPRGVTCTRLLGARPGPRPTCLASSSAGQSCSSSSCCASSANASAECGSKNANTKLSPCGVNINTQKQQQEREQKQQAYEQRKAVTSEACRSGPAQPTF